MKSWSRLPLELIVGAYFGLYLPYFVLVRWLALNPVPELGRAMTGLEILPVSQILSGLATLAFVWLAGWWRFAHHAKLGQLTVPVPTRWTVLSGVCTALVLVTVPLSVTFPGDGPPLSLEKIISVFSRRPFLSSASSTCPIASSIAAIIPA